MSFYAQNDFALLKGTASVILSNSPCKDGKQQQITDWIRNHCLQENISELKTKPTTPKKTAISSKLLFR